MTFNAGGQHILIGDVSFGEGGCGAAKPGVYGKISWFRPWIEMEMKKVEAPRYCKSGPNAGKNF